MNQKSLDGMKRTEDQAHSYKILKEAERQVLDLLNIYGPHHRICRLLAITLNNIACYQKVKGLFRAALRYLSQILWIEKFYLKEETSYCSTYLNISTILSCLGKHKESLIFAKKSLSLYSAQAAIESSKGDKEISKRVESSSSDKEAEITDKEQMKHPGTSNGGVEARTTVDDIVKKEGPYSSKEGSPESQSSPSSVSKSLIICYINVSTEYIQLGMKKEAEEVASRGLERAERLIGNNHYLCERLLEILEIAKKRRKDTTNSTRYPRTTLGDQGMYMRAKSAHTSNVVIDQKEGVKLVLDRVRGEVCIDLRGPVKLKRPPVVDHVYYNNVVKPHQGKVLPKLLKPFKPMPQAEKNRALQEVVEKGERKLRANSVISTYSRSKNASHRVRSIQHKRLSEQQSESRPPTTQSRRSQPVIQDQSDLLFESSSSYYSPNHKKKLDKIEERSEEMLRSREITTKDIKYEG